MSTRDHDFQQILARLNAEQREAVETLSGPVRVVSGAGTGKTTTLTLRIVNLMMKNVASANDILAVTFTNKAAREMRERISRLIGDGAYRLTLGTFHAVSMQILRRHAEKVGLKNDRFLVVDTDDQLRLVEIAMDELGHADENMSDSGKHSKEFKAQAKKFHGIIQKWKESALTEKALKGQRLHLEQELALEIWPVYQRMLLERNSCDFADLILHVVTLFETDDAFAVEWSNRWKYICVDEFQDTNELQLRWLKHICANTDNVYVIGDPDQAIYNWRSAKADIMTSVVDDWPNMKTIVLHRNYRSSQPILDAANNVVDENPREMPKELVSGQTGEAPRLLAFHNSWAEAEHIGREIRTLVDEGQDIREIAILVRSAYLMRVIEQELVRQKLAYKVSGGLRFFERQEIRDAMAYLRLIVDPSDILALERIVNRPTRGVGEKTAARVVERMRLEERCVVEALRETAKDKGLQAKARSGLESLANNLEHARASLDADMPHHEVLRSLLSRIGYQNWLLKTEEDKGHEKKENVEEMLSAAAEHATPEDFLVAATLNSEGQDGEGRCLSLMTIHAAKGMEFDVVFSPALETNILPNGRAMRESNGLEEERRICHVAWTRARRTLVISYCHNRSGADSAPSPFLDSSGLQAELVHSTSNGHGAKTFFGSRRVL